MYPSLWPTAFVTFGVFAVTSMALTGGIGRFREGCPPLAHHLRRISALAILGGLPCLWVLYGSGDLSVLGVRVGSPPRTLLSLTVLGPVASLVVWRAAGQPRIQADYPQIRLDTWTNGAFVLSLSTWALYLVGYEIFFRGLLLGPLIKEIGLLAALVVNVTAYVLAHADKDSLEMLACVPMGFLFAGLTLWTGSIMAPLLLHVVIAWSAEIGSVLQRRTVGG